MQSRRIHTNIAQLNLLAPQVYDVRVNAVRCFSGCSLLLRVINSELTGLSTWLTAPPPLNY